MRTVCVHMQGSITTVYVSADGETICRVNIGVSDLDGPRSVSTSGATANLIIQLGQNCLPSIVVITLRLDRPQFRCRSYRIQRRDQRSSGGTGRADDH